MSHEITIREDGFAEMAYVGAAPWHRLGNELKPGASKAVWRKAAGFDFEFRTTPVTYRVPLAKGRNAAGDTEIVREYGGRQVIYRSDNHKHMSIVSDEYNIVQPEAILDYFDDLAHKAGFQLNTAGTLYEGRQFWGLASVGDEAYISNPNDKIKAFLLMATSVDLSMPTTNKFMCERVVCKNTLSYGLSEAGGTTVKRSHRTAFNADAVNAELGIGAIDRFEHIVKAMRQLADTPMDDREMIAASTELFEVSADSSVDDLIKAVNSKQIKRLVELTVDQSDLIGAEMSGGKTAYSWLNGVTQMVDHESQGRTNDANLNRVWFGSGDALKTRAFDMLVDKYDLVV